jgi:hypothetical protein
MIPAKSVQFCAGQPCGCALGTGGGLGVPAP